MIERRSFLAVFPNLFIPRFFSQSERGKVDPKGNRLVEVGPVLQVAPKAPPLPDPTGEVIRVTDSQSLRRGVAEADPGATIVLAKGHYQIDELLITGDGLTIRGESGRRDEVVLDGQGRFTKIVRIRGAKDLTIADLTVANSRQYGVFFLGDSNVQGLKVYNVKFQNCYTRGLKGTDAERINDSSTDRYPLPEVRRIRPTAGQVRYCLFVNDEVNVNSQPFNGDYIGGIDMMWAKDWVIADNVFVNILGQRGGGRGAIFVWVNSESVVAERNLIVNCDRGVCFGNPSGGPLHMRGGIVKNNFVVAGRSQGIEICQAVDTGVLNNTVFCEDAAATAVQFHKIGSGNRLINNIVAGQVEVPAGVTMTNNLFSPRDDWFVNPRIGDLHLTRNATDVIGRGLRLAEVKVDFDGEQRSVPPNIGGDD